MFNLFNGFQKLSLSVVAALSSIVASQPAVVAKAPVKTPSPVATVIQDTVTKSGEYNYSGQSIKYIVNFPKQAGKITGNLSGTCSGPIDGNFDGKEGGQIEGKVSASCQVAFLKQDFVVNYSGKLYLKDGRADLNWQGNIPFTENHGSFTLNFSPEK
ncbi:hypothetical protein HY025_04615 [Candidatus Daviesbacteria bacterium]|nr:hypothetical protein [Candidatus Daviesbacteria bacterium]